MNLSQSQPGLQVSNPQLNFSPRSKYISEHGPHGPVPISQKLSSFPSLTILSLGTPISFSHISYASSSSSYTVTHNFSSGILSHSITNSQPHLMDSLLK